MEKINLHFFHGFLGLPTDWQQTISYFSAEKYQFHLHDLWDDKNKIEQLSFGSWSELKGKSIRPKEKNIAIGYSLGGRLLMHLPMELFERVILIAAHPGLRSGNERAFRRQSDMFWAKKFQNQDWESLMNQWDGQEVFMGDKNRPLRNESDFDRQTLSEVLLNFSLSKQKKCDEILATNKDKIFWVYGSEDKKFASLTRRLEKSLNQDHIIEIKSSGHSCHFDQPEDLSRIIKNAMSDI